MNSSARNNRLITVSHEDVPEICYHNTGGYRQQINRSCLMLSFTWMQTNMIKTSTQHKNPFFEINVKLISVTPYVCSSNSHILQHALNRRFHVLCCALQNMIISKFHLYHVTWIIQQKCTPLWQWAFTTRGHRQTCCLRPLGRHSCGCKQTRWSINQNPSCFFEVI